MFKNKKNVKPQEKNDLQKKSSAINDSTDNINLQSGDASLVQEEKQKAQEERQVTVISKKTSLTGDIEFNGDLQICGKVKGQIKSTSGTVSIMRSG
ncbi:polymer-forming cytoskeletal protein, partial [Klebsiella variicola]